MMHDVRKEGQAMPDRMRHDTGWYDMAQDRGWRMDGQDVRPHTAGYILTASPVLPVRMVRKEGLEVCLKLQIPSRIPHGFA